MILEDTTDAILLEQARKGDETAFRAIVLRYEKKVALTVIGMLGNCPEADDVGQEVFIRFFRTIDTFRQEASLNTFLTKIAINLSINELERRKRRRRFTLSSFAPPDDTHNDTPEQQIADPNNAYEQAEIREQIQKALDRIDEKLRAVITLRLIEGYSTQETADMLQIPLGTVLSRLSRAQEQLRKYLLP
ncbi:MAG: RNA polymerase sigma factor [Chitinophagales bacterium]|nr:RNA polymerase sigma factor [Chitinophagales bacterium]